MDADIIIVGAGASGLMCARELSKNGLRVLVLEARNRIGGRIDTIHPPGFSKPIESGAEFIHGNLPVTKKLVQEAGLKTNITGGIAIRLQNGKFTSDDFFIPDWEIFERQLRGLEYDMPIAGFLQTYFHDPAYEQLRNYIKGYAEGYDAADTRFASTFALRDEWLQKEYETQYRVAEGYSALLYFLASDIPKNGSSIKLSAPVKEIRWKSNEAEVHTISGEIFKAAKTIITVPLGVLQTGNFLFSPALPDKINAAHHIGFGGVIKVFIECTDIFWEDMNLETDENSILQKMGFL
ncbi:MAG: FAD-dependent oxidoreductase, partial [Chitinophagales bacterium]|nr:FAD-dependent oxidoreductase [Chitinophagales bacterium]